MKRVLVIGRNSYIGTAFQEYVKNTGTEIETDGISARDDAWKEVDFSRYDAILHVAAIVHKKESAEMQQQYETVNVQLPVEIAQKAKKAGVQKFLFMSTMAVFGNKQKMISVKSPCLPESMYGKSKLEAEKQLIELADEKFHINIYRPPMVYGKGCPGNYGRLAKLAYKMPFFPKIDNQRSMIYIENLCAYLYKGLEDTEENILIIHPQNAEYVNTINMIKKIRKVHGKKTIILPFPQKIMHILTARIGILQKVFGDLCYEKEMDKNCSTIDFETSVQKTEKGLK